MALHAAEEETIESLKQWWQENGRQLVMLIIVVFAAYTGWLLWQNARLDNGEAASDLYEEILSLAVVDQGVTVSEANRLRVVEAATQLQSEYAGSIYAKYGALFAAQQHVAGGNLDAAEDSLQWILDNSEDGLFASTEPGLILTANLRLGRVLLAKGELERALGVVNSVDPQTFEAAFAELRGDIYMAMGRTDDARDAYLAAQEAGSNSDALRMKTEQLADET